LHGLATSLAVVARTVGMLVGISALTAVALHRFYVAAARIPSPTVLCPGNAVACPAYQRLETAALLRELHTVFAGAAVCAGAAAILALVLLRPARR
ncbi:MAG: MFS transporter, partial [Acidimicrobiales bacterium]